ncbi:MAG: multidrug efflux SMR transporter [Bacteroidales bacterium]|nr:multidrug efflux SMR transporter [Bacteroidales bacterium]
MAWLYLILAAIFEIGWPLGFKMSSENPDRFWPWMAFASACMVLSGALLYMAQKTIPVSTAYVIWTGAGAVGTLIIGIFCFGDSASFMRLFFAFLIIVGIIGIETCR